MKKLLYLILTLLCFSSVSLAQDIYVDASAGGANNGSSWTNAYTDLQPAINAISAGGTIHVAAATYKPTLKPTGVTGTDDRDVTFYLDKNITILGGYPAGGGTRDAAANPTILSGDIGTAGDSTDNSYHVFITAGLTSATLIDGFTIRDGNANGSGLITYATKIFNRNRGGGMNNESSSSTMTNCIFKSNTASFGGGGMSNDDSSPMVTNVTFAANAASLGGGGMSNFSSSSPTVTNVTFVSNTVTSGTGGGMNNSYNSSPTVTNVTFASNTAKNGGGGMFNSSSSPTVTNVTFVSNTVTQYGGGMYNDVSSSPSVTNCIFWGNKEGTSTTATGADIENISSTTTVTYSSLQSYSGGTGCIIGDPLFVDAANGDFSLMACSPAINVGTAVSHTTDILGNPHFGIVDMGAYEYQGNAIASAIDSLTWTGAVSTAWNEVCNWLPAGIPTATNDVIIPAGPTNQPTLSVNTAVAKSVEMRSGASFTIAVGGELTINNSKAIAGRIIAFYNDGTVNNNGKLTMGNLTGIGQVGLYNLSTFNNNTGGEISIDSTSDWGIFNRSGDFTNDAKIDIGANSSVGSNALVNFSTFNNNAGGEINLDYSSDAGLYQYLVGTFTNLGKINIGANHSNGQHGIKNEGIFNNNAGGEISIDNVINYGIYNLRGTFTNVDKITIGANSSGGDYGIHNLTTFNNNTGAEINIDKSTMRGLSNEDGVFTNAAKITIGANGPVGQYGLYSSATFNNNTGGDIKIDNASDDGLTINDDVFTNKAKITLGSVASPGFNGIFNKATFSNNAGGDIKIDNSSGIGFFNVSGTFNNQAKVSIGANASIGEYGIRNNAAFNNNLGGEINIDNSTEAGLFHDGLEPFHNYSKITIGSSASVGKYGLLNESTFNNNAGGEINIDSTTNTGLVNRLALSGIFTNAAKINIGTNASVGLNGISNIAIFNNNSGGEINIDNSGARAFSSTSGTVNNSAKLTIGANAPAGYIGLYTEGIFNNNTDGEITIDSTSSIGLWHVTNTFTNQAKITIGSIASVGNSGLQNTATFNNNAGGEINIDNTNTAGLTNELGVFTNSAKIIIGTNTSIGDNGILNKATFNNNIGGDISIDRSSNIGLLNQAGSFTNAAKITTGSNASVGAFGIFNDAMFNSLTGGDINIDNSTTFGIINQNGEFTNAATITIGAIGNGGLWNKSIFNNNGCGKILLKRGKLLNSSGHTYTNTAFTHVIEELENEGTFTNNGILKYGSTTGNAIINATEKSVIVKDSPTPIFAYGGTFDGTVNGIYTDEAATVSAGTYEIDRDIDFKAACNLPNGTQTLYASITPSSCTTPVIVPFLYNNVVATPTDLLTWTGEVSTAWNDACNWSPAGIPTATNDVVIPGGLSNQPTISIDTAKAGSMKVESGATFTIAASGKLELYGSKANFNIESYTLINSGTVENNGILTIGIENFIDDYGLANYFHFNNNVGGEVIIDRSTEAAILNVGTITNDANITIGSNTGVGDYGFYNFSTFNNSICANLKIEQGKFRNNNGTAVTNMGYVYVADTLENEGTFTNDGVIKYGVLTNNAIVNSTISSIIVNDTLSTLFTYGGTYNGTVNGIFTDDAATVSAGTFTTPNGFVPLSTLPLGSQTLYAKITPTGGACSYVVPFLFVNFREIDVRGNYISIANGDMSPSASDLTDFGVAGINFGTISNIFTIVNEGTSTLTLGSNPVTKSGPHAADFTILQPSETTIAPGDSVSFDITFDPSVFGERNATISIANDDADESPYTFAILGNGFCNVPSTASITGSQNLSCAVTSVTRTASGGTSYAWSNGLGTNATANINNAGTYTVTVTAANGCSATATTAVSIDNTPPTVSITGTDSLNCTQNTVSRTASGGVSYAWSNGLGNSAAVTITNTGTYTVTVTAANGCSSTATTAVVFNNNLVVTASNDGPYEEQDAINLIATGGPSYSWAGPNGFTSNIVNPSIANASPAKAGIYTVTVTKGSCTGTATTNVVINCSSPGMSYYLAYVDGAEVEVFAPLVSEMEVQTSNRRMTVLAIPNCELPVIESTRLQLSGTGNLQYYNDNEAPYSLYENNGATYGQVFPANYYTFIARGYAQDNSQGVVVGPDVVRFSVVAGDREISSPTLSSNAICAGTSLTVSATASGVSSFNVGNMYQVFLSDENGKFGNQTLIGSSSSPNNIVCSIPNNIPSGANYKVVVRSSSPMVSSAASASLSITSSTLSLLSPTNDIFSGTQTEKAIQTINAENKISGSSNVMYKAGNSILLAPGFSATSGNVFSAKIEDVCGN